MTRSLSLSLVFALLLALLPGVPVLVAADRPSGAGKQAERDKQGKQTESIPEPDNCEDIKAGAGGEGTVTQSASQKDCKASRQLGAGSGTSSGTGSGKMQSGSGPR